MKANPIIDVRDGETEDAARERHEEELATARAAIAHVDRVLENGRLRVRELVAREFHKQIVEKLQSERDAALAWWRKALEFQDRYLESAKRLRDFAATLLEDLEGYRDSSRILGERAKVAERERDEWRALHDGLLRIHDAERACAVARTKDLETALERAWSDVLYLRDVRHRLDAATFTGLCQATMGRIDLALHPPPPTSASDRTGTEHHDAADPEDGCQAGARRP